MIITAPDQLRDRCRDLETDDLVTMCAAMRPGPSLDPLSATKVAMRTLARRHLALTAEVAELDVAIKALCAEANPALLGARGVGTEVAATLLVTAGDNPHRMHSEAAFAALCGASPVEASSGRTTRHRLTRAATARPTTLSGASSWCGLPAAMPPAPTPPADDQKARTTARSSATSSATSHA